MVEKMVSDAGHGGKKPGAVYQGRRESDDALRLAMAVGNILEENGYDVIYTRTTDATQSVGQKAAIANEEGADLFLSIHRNAADSPGQNDGIQTLLYADSGLKKKIAERINANLEALGFRNIGVDIRPNLVVLNSTRMPALLVEAGFIDSDKDNQLFDSRFQALAQAIAEGIMETLEESAATEEGVSADSLSPVASVSDQTEDPSLPDKELYRVQAGAYREREYAENLLSLLENDGFPAYIIYHDGLYKVQIGAYARLSNAIAMEREVREKRYNTYITTS